jgi:FAD/FMN-containing dehydrogenase
VITAAVLKLQPRPSAGATAWIEVPDPRRAVALLAHLRQACGDRLTAFELLSRRCIDAVVAHRPAMRDPLPGAGAGYVLLELSDSGGSEALAQRLQEGLQGALEAGLATNAVVAKSASESAALWAIRETVPEAQFANVKHDVAVPVSSVPELLARAGTALASAFPGAPIYAFGHIGDGNIHYNVGDQALLAQREAVNRVVYGVVAELGGSISAEHGLGQLKREEIRHHKDALELELMRTLKAALDPQGLMNPGKVL